MRKLFCMVVLLATAALGLQAQNIQLHYDFGRQLYKTTEADRQRLTLTLEQFKADRWGSWFYFVDLDINTKALEAPIPKSPVNSTSANSHPSPSTWSLTEV